MANQIKELVKQQKMGKRKVAQARKFVDAMSNRSKFEAQMIRQGLGK